jgi:hypothetical protein
MPRKDIYKDGVKTQFSSTNQPENSGRRPSVFAKYIKENRLSLDDMRAVISSLLGYSAPEINAILKDKVERPPIAIVLLLKAITADMNKGDLSNFIKLAERAFGKPEKTINHEIGAISPETLAMLNEVFAEKPEQKENRRKPKVNGRKPGSTEN